MTTSDLGRLLAHWRRVLGAEQGATMVEYALLLALMAIALIGALEFFAGERLTAWQNIGSSMS